MTYRLLDTFRGLFAGKAYHHRKSTQGDRVAMHLYEDLYELGQSARYLDRVDAGLSVINTKNLRSGVKARRGDGSFGAAVPNVSVVRDAGYAVGRGSIATIEIGIEVKIMQKAMKKQVDRVIGDLRRQSQQFHTNGGKPICVGIVGVNRAPYCRGYEGKNRSHLTDGRQHKHPIDEADETVEKLRQFAASAFDEFLVLSYEAVNEAPFGFVWADENETHEEYGAALVRISQRYERSL